MVVGSRECFRIRQSGPSSPPPSKCLHVHFHDEVEAGVDAPAGNSTSHTITHQQYIHIDIELLPHGSRCRKKR